MKYFDFNLLEQLFPFYLLLNENLQVVQQGKSIQKLCSVTENGLFTDHFEIVRPHITELSLEGLKSLCQHIVLIKGKNSSCIFRGHLQYVEDQADILLLISPWFNSIDQIKEANLSAHDFALHDPTIELLHLLRTKEIANEDTRELLNIVNKQRNELKRLSMVASANKSGIIFLQQNGVTIWCNQSFENMTGFQQNEIIGKNALQICLGHGSNNEVLKKIAAAIETDGEMEEEILLYNKKAIPFWAKVKGQPLPDDTYTTKNYFLIIEDITSEKRNKELIQQQKEKYYRIIANMNLGLVEVDNDGIICYVNNSFTQLSGYAEHELMGKPGSNLFLTKELETSIQNQNKEAENGYYNALEIPVTIKDGQKKWWLVSSAGMFDASNEKTGAINIFLDITEQKRLNLQLDAARNDAENSSRAKEIFLANMSHEIRTPMNAIIGMTRQLQKSVVSPTQKDQLKIINTAGENLLTIINDILDFSKIEAGKLNLEHIGFDIKKLIKNAVQTLQYKAQEKGLKLVYTIDKDIFANFKGDPYRINQIIMNLLSNSLKFTKVGKVEINCLLVQDQLHGQQLELTVSDTGKGMDEAFVNDLFDKFSQEDESIARSYGGTGLGMSIIKQLVELMNGSIEVKSRKNEGTSVSIQLTLSKCDTKDCNECLQDDCPEKETETIPVKLLEGKKILLVEDNEMNRLVASTILEEYKIIVIEAVNGQEAINMMQEQPDIVLMDMHMPVLNGLEATKHIRTCLQSTVPIIALTANAIKGEKEKCLNAGMDDYLSKPFNETEFIKILLKWINHQIPQSHAHKELLPAEPVEQLTFDLTHLQKISRGNPEIMLKIVKAFMHESELAITEMKETAVIGNVDKIKLIVHRIKSSLKSMGIDQAVSMAEEIENFTDTDFPGLLSLVNDFSEKIKSATENIKKQFFPNFQ